MKHYVMQLIPWLLRLSHHDFILFYRVQGLPPLASALRKLSTSDRGRVQLVEIEDQEEIFGHAHRFDLYFCPLNGFAPNLLDRPTLGTLADIQDQYFPQYFTEVDLRVRRILYPFMARAVTTLLTISEFSKRSICEKYGIAPSKVTVTYLAASDDIVLSKGHWPTSLPPLPKRYVFFPANLYPHKNHELLLQSLRYIRRSLGIECDCVMTGHEVSPGIAIKERIDANGLTGYAHWLGHVPPGALRYLYENAVALTFPSEFEGFGMPLVEAMHCNCPVIATPTTCVPEVVAEAGLLVEPTPEAFGQAIARLVEEPATRDSLVAKGRLRTSRFAPKVMAEATLAAIEEAPGRFAGRYRAHAARGVSYVVRSSTGGDRLVKSLGSVAYEAHAEDEVVILAQPEKLSAKALALADNMENMRLIDPVATSSWIDQLHHDVVCCIDEGELVAEGSSGAATAVLAEKPDCQAVRGQAISADSAGNYYRAHSGLNGEASDLPSAAVYWRRSSLVGSQAPFGNRSWPAQVVNSLDGRIASIERTLAIVDGSPTRGQVHAPPSQRAAPTQPVEAIRPISARAKWKTRLWAPCAERLMGSKRLFRRLADIMPGFIARRMRQFYVHRVEPHACKR